MIAFFTRFRDEDTSPLLPYFRHIAVLQAHFENGLVYISNTIPAFL